MVHDAHGWWIAEAGAPAPVPALSGDVDADVVIVGGGYTGLWTAWEIAEAEPNARVVVLEAERCGMGPSGRNGGFPPRCGCTCRCCASSTASARARELCEASVESVDAIGAWCKAQEVDAWHREAPHLVVSCAPRQDGASAGAITGDDVVALTQAETRAVCDSPVFRGGVATRAGATVHPARLAFGLRERLLGRGVRIFEGTPVKALRSDRGIPTRPAPSWPRPRAGASARARGSSPSTPPPGRFTGCATASPCPRATSC